MLISRLPTKPSTTLPAKGLLLPDVLAVLILLTLTPAITPLPIITLNIFEAMVTEPELIQRGMATVDSSLITMARDWVLLTSPSMSMFAP